MEKKDPFDEILMKCLSDREDAPVDKVSSNVVKRADLIQCHNCNELICQNYRYCPNCGEPTADMSGGIERTFIPIVMQKKYFRVTLLDVDPDFRINGEYFTRVKLRIENLTESRLHLSLTYVDSVLIDASSRQLNPIDGEESELPGVFDPWFYIYPQAYREGILIFPEVHEKIKSIYICCNPQNADEEELFCFLIND